MKDEDRLKRVLKVRLTVGQHADLVKRAQTTGIKAGVLARVAICGYLTSVGHMDRFLKGEKQ